MKKFVLLLLGAFFLAGCQSGEVKEDTPKVSEEKRSEQESEPVKVVEKDDKQPLSETDNGESYEEGFGKLKTVGVGYSDEVGIDGTDSPVKPIDMGPMKLSINGVGIVDVEPDDEAKFLFNEQDKARVIIIDMKAENTSEEDISFHPNQAIIVTDTGEQIESDMGLTGDAGGDFLGKVTKEGQTWWILKHIDKEIKKITLIVNPPNKTDDWENIGEEKRIEFEILSWEEAKKKDGV